MRYFHSTPIANVGSIMLHGLDSRKDPTVGDLENYVHDESQGYNDFTLHLLECEWVASFEVDVAGLVLEPGPDGPGTYTIRTPIHPERLTLLGFQNRNGDWVKL